MTKREHQMLKEVHESVVGTESGESGWWWLAFISLVVVLGLLMCLETHCHASETMLIPDSEFTDRAWTQDTVERFCAEFVKSRLTYEDRVEIIDKAWTYHLSGLTVLAKLEQENSLVTGDYPRAQHQARMDRAMGWGLTKRSRWGFENQLDGGCAMLRRNFDAWRRGWKKKIHEARKDERWIVPENAATWSLYCYCPFFAEFINWGGPANRKTFMCEGNRAFVRIWREWKPRWEAVAK